MKSSETHTFYNFIEDENHKKSISINTPNNTPNKTKKRGRPLLRDEKRSERMILLLTPTLSQKLREAALAAQSSLNDYIFNLIEKEINENTN